MKQSLSPRLKTGALAAFLATGLHSGANAAITVDGTRDDVGETEYSGIAVQTHDSAWGTGNALVNMHSAQVGKLLHIFLAGRANGNAIILFVDSKAGGVSYISNNLIASGGDEVDINNLGNSDSSGMTFEAGFEPDYAIRVYGDGSNAYASIYDLDRQFRTYIGQVDSTPEGHGVVQEIAANWVDVPAASADYATAVDGIEMSLNLALLGVPEGDADVQLMAMLVNGSSSYGSNQVLDSLGTNAEMAGGVNSIDFETETGTQTLIVAVDRPALADEDDEDGDGLTNDIDAEPTEQTRDVEFSVDMNVEALSGHFTPPSNVRVQFFTGSEPALSELVLTDDDDDLIYTGTLTAAKGYEGDSLGTYKFVTNDPNNQNSGYEEGYDRSLVLGPAETTQEVGTVFFSNVWAFPYSSWASQNAGGQGPTDDFDGDGVPNGIEHFMGETGSSFTPNPPMVNGTIAWPRGEYTDLGTIRVLISDDLVTWSDVTGDMDTSDPSQVLYTLPNSGTREFVRFSTVTP